MRVLAVAALALSVACSRGPLGPTGASTIAVSGTVTSRIDASAVSGSTITFSGDAGSHSAAVTAGHYDVTGLALGDYVVTVTGPSHVQHITQKVIVNATTGPKDFTVLTWNTGRFGVTYDLAFNDFFQMLARGAPERAPAVIEKWRTAPTRIYVTDENLSADEFAEFLQLVKEVNAESVPDMSGGWLPPIPVESGPPLGDYLANQIVIRIRLGDDVPHDSSPGCEAPLDPYIACARVRMAQRVYVTGAPWSRGVRKYFILHELFHAFGAGHAWTPGYPGSGYSELHGSAMSGTPPDLDNPRLADVDKFAFWLVYHPGTLPNSLAPDSEPIR